MLILIVVDWTATLSVAVELLVLRTVDVLLELNPLLLSLIRVARLLSLLLLLIELLLLSLEIVLFGSAVT